jgi:hypothetical protein
VVQILVDRAHFSFTGMSSISPAAFIPFLLAGVALAPLPGGTINFLTLKTDAMTKKLSRMIDHYNQYRLVDYFKMLGMTPIASNDDCTEYQSAFAPGPYAHMTVDHKTNTFTDQVTGTTGKIIDFITAWWGIVQREVFENIPLYGLDRLG